MYKLEEKRENSWVQSLTLLQDLTDAKDYIREHSLYNSSQKILLQMIKNGKADLWFLFDIIYEVGKLDEDVQVYIAEKQDFTKYGKLCPAAEKLLPLNDCTTLEKYGYKRFNAFRDYVIKHKIAVAALGDFLAVLYKPKIARIKKISTASEDYVVYQLNGFIASYPINCGRDNDFNENAKGYNPTDIIEYVADVAFYGTTLLLEKERQNLRNLAEGKKTNQQVRIYDHAKRDESHYYAKNNYEGLPFAEHFVYRLYSYIKQMVFASFNDEVYQVLLETYQKSKSQMVYLLLIEAMRKFGYTIPGVIYEIGKDTEMSPENLNYFTGRYEGFYVLNDLNVIELIRCPREKVLGYFKLRSREKPLGFLAEQRLESYDYKDEAVKAAYELKYGFESVKLFEAERFEELYQRCGNLLYNDETVKLYRPLFSDDFVEKYYRMRDVMDVLAEKDRIVAEEARIVAEEAQKQAEIEARKKAELERQQREAEEDPCFLSEKDQEYNKVLEALEYERCTQTRQKNKGRIFQYCSVTALIVIIIFLCFLF